MLSRVLCTAVCLAAAVTFPAYGAVVKAPIRVIDGDTVQINRTTYRVMGVDTPEKRYSCSNAQTVKLTDTAAKASARTTALLAPPAVVRYYTHGKDKYGRTLAVFTVRGHARGVHAGKEVNLAKILIKEGLGRPYNGETRYDPCK